MMQMTTASTPQILTPVITSPPPQHDPPFIIQDSPNHSLVPPAPPDQIRPAPETPAAADDPTKKGKVASKA